MDSLTAPNAPNAPQVRTARTPTPWSEDWLAVLLGSGVIGLALLGVRPVLKTARWSDLGELASGLSGRPALLWLLVCAGVFSVSAVGVALMRGNLKRYALGFPVVFALAWLAQVLAAHTLSKRLGFEYVVFALALGLFVSNVLRVPDWLRESVRTEYFLKTGLVLLGSSILFRELASAGALGLLQAVLVVIVVWYAAFWLARRLGLDDEFAAMLSSAVAICGVSAAIAACGALQGDRKKLSYITSLVLIVAVPMMIVMPWLIRALDLPELVGGAWLGGTLDTSGSVVAAGELVSPKAMKAGVIVKFSQNVLIGFAAFGLALWWTVKQGAAKAERPDVRVIWERFPKFVLGFMAVSLVFSFLIPATVVADCKPALTTLRNLWFALAFACIGLETDFRELLTLGGGRPAAAFVLAQTFNVVWTLIIALLLFGGVLWPAPAFE